MKNIILEIIYNIKKKKEISKKYNEILEINKTLNDSNYLSQLVEKFSKIETLYEEIERNDNGKKKILLTPKEDFDFQIQSQIKKKYFSKLNHYLLDYNEFDSLGFINGLYSDLLKCKNTKYDALINSFINDTKSIIDNHSIIYHNYRENPISFNLDPISEKLLEYICSKKIVNDQITTQELNLNYDRVKKLFEYFESQNILSEPNENGTRRVLIPNSICVFSSGLNPNELSYISVSYNYDIKLKLTNKTLLEKIDNEMNGREFEKITKKILEQNGFEDVKVTPQSGDFGVDVIAQKDSVKYVIQCKNYSSSVGIKAVQEVIGSKYMNKAHVAVVLTNNYFTKSAKELANSNGVLLWDRDKLAQLLLNVENK